MTLYHLHCRKCKQTLVELEELNGSKLLVANGYCEDCNWSTSSEDKEANALEVVKP